MLAINVSIPNLTVARLEQFPLPQMTDNKPSFTRKPHVVIFRQGPFAANEPLAHILVLTEIVVVKKQRASVRTNVLYL